MIFILGLAYFLFVLLGYVSAALPEGYKLFSGEQVDQSEFTNQSFSVYCDTDGVGCDQSKGIIIVNGSELGSEVKSFSDLKYMPRMKILNMSNLNLTMLFPTEICTLEHLMYLDLSNNNFIGTIPPCICNLAYLKYLNLSNNRFEGGLPSCVNGMENLEELDLSCNILSEELPTSLNYIGTLSEVNYRCNSYKQYQSDITVPNYFAGDKNCESCMKHEAECPDELYQYGSGTYSAAPEGATIADSEPVSEEQEQEQEQSNDEQNIDRVQ